MNTVLSADSSSFIDRGRKGQLPLWKAFWLVFVPTPFILYLTYLGALWGWLQFNPLADITAIALLISSLSFFVMAMAGVVVWRCSANVASRTWRYLALLVAALYLLWYGRRVVSIWLFLSTHGISQETPIK